MKKRPDCILHWREILEPEAGRYPGSDEGLSRGSPLARKLGLARLGIHHELLPPGQRTSYPHSESHEEEFVYVIEGRPSVWLDGEMHELEPGDAVGWPAGTGINHCLINNSEKDVRLLVVGERSKKENKVYYPLNPERRPQCEGYWWEDVPKRPQGPHDGLPDAERARRKKKS